MRSAKSTGFPHPRLTFREPGGRGFAVASAALLAVALLPGCLAFWVGEVGGGPFEDSKAAREAYEIPLAILDFPLHVAISPLLLPFGPWSGPQETYLSQLWAQWFSGLDPTRNWGSNPRYTGDSSGR